MKQAIQYELVGQLKSLRNDVEIIIIDDGSTDGSKSILNEYNFFKIIHNTTNSGKGYSIIAGAKVATTKKPNTDGWRFGNRY